MTTTKITAVVNLDPTLDLDENLAVFDSEALDGPYGDVWVSDVSLIGEIAPTGGDFTQAHVALTLVHDGLDRHELGLMVTERFGTATIDRIV